MGQFRPDCGTSRRSDRGRWRSARPAPRCRHRARCPDVPRPCRTRRGARVAVLAADEDDRGRGGRAVGHEVQLVLPAVDRRQAVAPAVPVERAGLAVVARVDDRAGRSATGSVGVDRGDLRDVARPADRVARDLVDRREPACRRSDPSGTSGSASTRLTAALTATPTSSDAPAAPARQPVPRRHAARPRTARPAGRAGSRTARPSRRRARAAPGKAAAMKRSAGCRQSQRQPGDPDRAPAAARASRAGTAT